MMFAERYGPWAVITGASDGTGREFARAVAALGVSVILIARRHEALRALAQELTQAHGVECVVATIDLAQADAGERIAEAAAGREVGLFISNAGADTNGSPFLDGDIEAWTRLVSLNVVTMMRASHHFAAAMRERGRGGVLLVNSGACYGGLRGIAAYSASKAFMLCFAEALWGELRPAGVDVLTMVLGQTDTPAYRKLIAEKGLPLPANWASPEDVARVALEQLPNGPIQNWGASDDEIGFAPNSPAQRRQRILAIGG